MDEVTNSKRDFHNDIQNSLLQWIRIYLLGSFNWPGTKSLLVAVACKIVMLSCLAIIILQHVFVFQNSNNIDYVTGTYFTMVAVMTFLNKHIILYRNRKTVAALLNIINNELWPINAFGHNEKLWNIIKAVRMLIISYCISAAAISQILMYFPYVDELPGQKRMPILCWYPYDINKSPMHEITYIWISLVGVFSGFGISSFDSMFMYFQLNTILQLRLLRMALTSIDKKYRYIDSDEELYKKLVFCIQYHQKLNKFYQQIQELYEIHNAVNLLIGGITFCCLTYLVQTERDPMKVVKLIIYIFCTTMNVGVYCVAGSCIKSETENLSFAIYNTGWERSSKRFQKAVLFMIRAAQEPRTITAGKLAEIGNMTLISVIKTAFSISVFLNDVNQTEY